MNGKTGGATSPLPAIRTCGQRGRCPSRLHIALYPPSRESERPGTDSNTAPLRKQRDFVAQQSRLRCATKVGDPLSSHQDGAIRILAPLHNTTTTLLCHVLFTKPQSQFSKIDLTPPKFPFRQGPPPQIPSIDKETRKRGDTIAAHPIFISKINLNPSGISVPSGSSAKP